MPFEDRPGDGIRTPDGQGIGTGEEHGSPASEAYRGLQSATPRSRWHGVKTGAVVAAIAVLAGGAGALAAHHYFNAPSSPISVAAPTSGVSQVGSTHLNGGAIAKGVEPAVVDVNVVLEGGAGTAAGTGMILTASGEVLTNNHVVEGAVSIKVSVPGHSTPYTAKVVGVDPTQDVALIQLQGVTSQLPTVTLAGSGPQVGEPVVAIGNALGMNGTPTVTDGTVTALSRNITAGDTLGNSEHLHGMLQTDAPLAPGDSGGPLVNGSGQVVGMDTAAYSGQQSSANFTNVGFAIPIQTALSIVQQMRSGQASSTAILAAPPMIGVSVSNASQANPFYQSQAGMPTSGAFVQYVEANSPAAQAGIRPGDVIVAFNGQAVSTAAQMATLEKPYHPGQSVSITWVNTQGQQQTGSMTLVAGPPK